MSISIFTITYFIWISSEIILNRFMRSKATDKQNKDKSSLPIIWATIACVITLAVFISIRYYLPVSANYVVRYVGLFMIFTGIILRLIIVRSLGRFFTVDVTIRQNHRLKKDGFYKYLRHPSYFASLISFAGFGISLNNWLSLILVISAMITVFINRIKVEESVLAEHFGKEYIDYKKSTKQLFPFIF